MTRSLSEGDVNKSAAATEYGVRQLFRRPAPHVGDEVAYAVMDWGGGADIPDDSKTFIDLAQTGVSWSQGYISPEGLALEPVPFFFDFDEGKIRFRSSGLYHAQFAVQWADTFPSPGPSYLGTILEYFGNCPVAAPCGDWMATDVMFNNQDWMQQWLHATGHVVVDQDAELDSWFGGSVIQKSGTGDKFLSDASLIVTKLTGYDSTTGAFVP